MPESRAVRSRSEEIALVELVNRVVDRGVALTGEVTISVADIDLLHLGIRLLLCSPDHAGLFGSSLDGAPAPARDGRGS